MVRSDVDSRGEELMVLPLEVLARRAPSNESTRPKPIQVCSSKGAPTVFGVDSSN